MEEKDIRPAAEKAEPVGAQGFPPPAPGQEHDGESGENPSEKGGNEPSATGQEPVHRATRSQRVAAWIAAIGMIIITLCYTYAIYSGALFSR